MEYHSHGSDISFLHASRVLPSRIVSLRENKLGDIKRSGNFLIKIARQREKESEGEIGRDSIVNCDVQWMSSNVILNSQWWKASINS